MNDTFYSYLDNTDKMFMAIETANEIEMEKQLLAYEYASRIYDIKVKQSDLRVLTESGTYEDMEALYMEAGEEAEEKKKNIISRMLEAISKLIDNIVKGIKNLFKGKKENEIDNAIKNGGNVKAKDPEKSQGIISKGISKIMGLVRPGSEVSRETADKVANIVKGVSAALAAVGIATFAIKRVNKSRKDGENTLNDIDDFVGELKKNPPLGEGAQQVITEVNNFAKIVGSSVKEKVQTIFGFISGPTQGDSEDQTQLGDKKGNQAQLTTNKQQQEALGDKRAGQKADGDSRQGQLPIEDKGQIMTKKSHDLSDEEENYDSADDLLYGDSFMESEELEDDMNELADLFASL